MWLLFCVRQVNQFRHYLLNHNGIFHHQPPTLFLLICFASTHGYHRNDHDIVPITSLHTPRNDSFAFIVQTRCLSFIHSVIIIPRSLSRIFFP